MFLTKNGSALPFLVEETAHPGVRRVAEKVAADVEKVSGVTPELVGECGAAHVLCATLGCSPLADGLIAAGKLPQAEEIRGKWECYAIAKVDERLVILGSDKRGTIYGLFALSQYIGVSPLIYWGDADPLHRDDIALEGDIQTVTKEPSVRYRGFFINDEWPCFGAWATEHFGGVNAQMYDHVFELLLRLRGNYFWPAMWASVFGEEGPGPLNEELADLYGIVVGNSHHEPCLRAGEEFKRSIQNGAPFGDVWNFRQIREGITLFWADGLKRSGKFEHLVTIGMRGEADSAMLGEDAGLRANIEYLKDAITVQEQLIQAHCGPKAKDQPRVLALYKEVEPFFYGSETVEGLKDWKGLTNTVCMLCEDNHGFMRSLPTPEMTAALKARNCGWGMYYHVDYHGGPTSYEWMPSTPFSKLWEQMCLAYDSGIRDVWILNVGDLKGNEVSLNQFLDLAYDYDRWGSHDAANWRHWLNDWTKRTFPGMSLGQQATAAELLTEMYGLNGRRRPEALNASVYHPCHEEEASRLCRETGMMLKRADILLSRLAQPTRDAFISMVHLPMMMSTNLVGMHLFAGLNAHYAAQGRPIANDYAELVEDAMALDDKLAMDYAAFREGKWRGMEQEAHIGFTSWNEDGCLLPTRTYVTPWHKPRLSLSRADDMRVYGRTYGKPMCVTVDDFCDAGVTDVHLEVANAGVGQLAYVIEGGAPWLTVTPQAGVTEKMDAVTLHVDRALLAGDVQQTILAVRTEDAVVHVAVSAKGDIRCGESAFLPRKAVVAMEAHHFQRQHSAGGAAFRILPGLGRSGNAVKVYPAMAAFDPADDAPSLTYRFYAEAAGEHTCELWLTPTAPVRPGTAMRCTVQGAGQAKQVVTCVPADYRAGENSDPRWCAAVTSHIRKVQAVIRCIQGLNEVTIGAVDPNFSLERILIYPAGHALPESYLGPKESAVSPE